MIDRIIELEPGVRATAVKCLRADEEYLKDHFPRFPVMPGVLMLEAMFQTAMFLVRKSENFAHSAVLLKEVRNVKFAGFVQPGQVLTLTAVIHKDRGEMVDVKTQGTVEGSVAVSGRLLLERFNVRDRYPEKGPSDAYLRHHMQETFVELYQPSESQQSIS